MLFGIHTAFKAKFVIIYLIWQLVSVSWNCFLIAFYLDLDLPFTKNEDFNLVNLWTGKSQCSPAVAKPAPPLFTFYFKLDNFSISSPGLE